MAAPVKPDTFVNTDDCCRLPVDPIWPTSPLKQPESFATKRLELELKDFIMGECDIGVSAFPENDTIMLWKGSITGAEGSVFEGKQYELSLYFPNEYPFKPPLVRFSKPAPFHPNVGSSCYKCDGKISLGILQEVLYEWSSTYGVRTLLLSIKAMLDDPNLSTPINPEAATLWSDQKEYKKMVEKFYVFPEYGFRSRFNFDLKGTTGSMVGTIGDIPVSMFMPIKPYTDFISKDGTYKIVSDGRTMTYTHL